MFGESSESFGKWSKSSKKCQNGDHALVRSQIQSSPNGLKKHFFYMFLPTNVSFHIYFSFKTFENIVYLLYIIIIYCNIDNPTCDMHLFYTYLLDFAKIIILGSLVPLLVPISIESIVIWTELKHNLSIHSEIRICCFDVICYFI